MDAKLILIGASAGGFDALLKVLGALPRDFRVPIVLVLHQPPQSESRLAKTLGGICALPVREAEDKEPISDGTVYVAPPDYHLLVERGGSFSLSTEDPVNYSRPSIDPTFESAAIAFGPSAVGVILTGANADGSRGLRAVTDAGGVGVVEDPRTAAFPMMPEAAIAVGKPQRVLPLAELVLWLSRSEWKTLAPTPPPR